MWVADPILPTHEGEPDPGTRGIIRGERSSLKRQERRALEREGKPVPPCLQPREKPQLTKEENRKRQELQDRLSKLNGQWHAAKSSREQAGIWDEILETKDSLKRLLGGSSASSAQPARRPTTPTPQPAEGLTPKQRPKARPTPIPNPKTPPVKEEPSESSQSCKPEKAEAEKEPGKAVKEEEEPWTTAKRKKKKRKKEEKEIEPMEVD